MTKRDGKTGLKGPTLSEEFPDHRGDAGLAPELEAESHTARLAAARSALLDVETLPEASARAAEVGEAAKKLRGFAWEPDELGLPPGLTVRPVGKRGGLLYFLNPLDELVEISASKLSQQGELDNLFSLDGGQLWAYYAQLSKQGELRIKYEDVRRDLIQACGRVAHREGVFDPAQRLRGRGAWRTDEGVLILHLGDRLWVNGEERELGQVDGRVYPREETLPPPIAPGLSPDDDAGDVPDRWAAGVGPDARGVETGRRILQDFATWRFDRGADAADFDARLILGWMVCVLLGGALDWRPQVFIVGDAGTGKSTLQRYIKAVLGRRLLNVADATSAGIYQTLGVAAIGVSIDEFENEGDDASESNAGKVLKLARLSSSGDRVVRGGQDGVPSNYEAQGVFAFSGINMPALKPAELSRMAIALLHPQTDTGRKAPKLSEREGEEMGRRLLGRAVARWAEWPGVLEAWRAVLLEAGHSARTADQFGTLLAAAHLVTHDGKPLEAQARAVASVASRTRLHETANVRANWERCIDHLLSAQPDAWRGNHIRSVGALLGSYVDGSFTAIDGSGKTRQQSLRERLAQAGLSYVDRSHLHADDGADVETCGWLFVPSNHPQVAALFRGTTWGSRAGGAEGTWSSALRSAPRTHVEDRPAKLDGRTTYGMQLRLDRLIMRGDFRPEDVIYGQEEVP